ncbi:hypothetical protein FHW83_001428 [Duganella sp. SG902]|uniref:FRG domain-containing protein n=1 Tax=Duganella sp. SG902 TaxID=2587016 RepID=UPI00159DE102|nr:FRG domain-containing protein [Duganella sp. SG902]NVM75641.1 hypothetical protein [Duganella sp. SG902]
MDLPIQLLGFVEDGAQRYVAMMCRDSDRPDEVMIQWAIALGPQPSGMGLLMRITKTAATTFKLRTMAVYKTDEGGGLFLPTVEAVADYNQLIQVTAELQIQENSLTGTWTAPDSPGGRISFELTRRYPTVKARKLRSWDQFKTWASAQRLEGRFVDFRGHGCSTFSLSTSFHRAGRARIERFCYQTMPEFQNLAESILDERFNRKSPEDFAIAVGLAQHHGLPTPLLDWSKSPYVAAFFAFSDALENLSSRPDSTHVRIYALNAAVSQASGLRVTLTAAAPIASHLSIVPWKNPRLLAQQGCFLLTNLVNLEGYLGVVGKNMNTELLTAVDIPISSAAEALQDLQFMGLSAATMFPGLDGICRTMRHQMAFKKKS